MLAGLIAGAFLQLVGCASAAPPSALSPASILWVGLMLGAAGFLVLLWILYGLARFTFASVAGPALLNSLLTALLTTALVSAIDGWRIALLIGVISGLVIGRILCLISRCPGTSRSTHGLHR